MQTCSRRHNTTSTEAILYSGYSHNLWCFSSMALFCLGLELLEALTHFF